LKNVNDPLSLSKNENLKINQLSDLLTLNQMKINLKGFCTWFVWEKHFQDFLTPLYMDSVGLTDLKHAMARMSMTVTDLDALSTQDGTGGKPFY